MVFVHLLIATGLEQLLEERELDQFFPVTLNVFLIHPSVLALILKYHQILQHIERADNIQNSYDLPNNEWSAQHRIILLHPLNVKEET